jgi:glutaminyl-peptide cyclotransferase
MTRFVLVLAATLQVLACGCGQSEPTFTGEHAWEYLTRQCGYGPRVVGSSAHDSTRALIVDRLSACGARVSVQRFEVPDPYAPRTMELRNIIGSFFPDREKRVLLAAHYDTRPWADQESDTTLWDQPILGANDGASGVAVLLELADVLAAQPPSGVGVDLVFFDGEDYGKEGELRFYLLGSRYFAANLAGYRPRCGILLDMVGAADAEIGKEGYSLQRAPDLTDELFGRAAELELTVFVPENRSPVIDDHLPLQQAGIAIVDLIGLPYPYWHTLADTPDKCSAETLRQVGTLITNFIYDFPY